MLTARSTAATSCSRQAGSSKHQLPCRPQLSGAVIQQSVAIAGASAANCQSCGIRRSLVIAAAGKPAKGFGKPKKVDAGLDPSLPCPCGSGSTHEACCLKYLSKQSRPASAEQLLRSRYTAYALKNPDYIADTTHVESEEYTGSRSTYLTSVRATQRRADWLGLTIHGQEPGKEPNETIITFTADYVLKEDKAGKRQSRPEKSRFWKDPRGGQWWYMGSDLGEDEPSDAPAINPSPLPGINLPSLPSFPTLKF